MQANNSLETVAEEKKWSFLFVEKNKVFKIMILKFKI